MAFKKYNFIFLFVLLSYKFSFAQTRFSPKSCLDSIYKMKMVHQGPLFGLIDQEFVIDKKYCLIQITQKKYFPKKWFIDVCRGPVHIKLTSVVGGVDVAKKETDCLKFDKTRDTSDFCSQMNSLMDAIQDDGLIFANGDRDDLGSDHGKTFCVYLLLKKYFHESVIFSRYSDVPDIFTPLSGADLRESGVPQEMKIPEQVEPVKKVDESGQY